MGTMEAVTDTYTITDGFSNIRVSGAECDVRLIPSEDASCTVLCRETDRIAHTVTVKNGTLTVERTDNRKWFEHIGFMWSYWGPIEVNIYLPEIAYENLYVRTASGKIDIPDGFFFDRAELDGVSGDIRFMAEVDGELRLKAVSGDIEVSGTSPETLSVESTSGVVTVNDIAVNAAFACRTVSGTQRINHLTCKNAMINSTSGSVIASDLIASEHITMEAISGSLKLTGCDADTLYLKTVSGGVAGTLCSEKQFLANTTSGSISVPDTAGGLCEVKTVSGNIHLEVQDTAGHERE